MQNDFFLLQIRTFFHFFFEKKSEPSVAFVGMGAGAGAGIVAGERFFSSSLFLFAGASIP
jgi:hypothetical protein